MSQSIVNKNVGDFSANSYYDAATATTTDLLCITTHLSANFSNSTTTLLPTSLTFPIGANETWVVEWHGAIASAANTTGTKIGWTGPNGALAYGEAFGVGTSSITITQANFTGLATPNPLLTFATSTSCQGFFRVSLNVVNSTVPGFVTLTLGATTASASVLMFRGARMIARRSVGV